MAKTKWIQTTTVAVVALLLAAGCGQTKQPAQVQGNAGTAAPPQTQENAKPPAQQTPAAPQTPQEKQLKIKAYYGDSELEKLLQRDVTITYKQDSDKYAAALQALRTSEDSKLIPLFKGIEFKSVALKNGQLNVDVTIQPEGRLGSGGEKLLLDALGQTVFQFQEIQAVDVLVEGKQVESLMGHMDLPHPIKRK